MMSKKDKDKDKDKETKFFTLIFVENGEEKTTKVPAKKGKTLGDSVSQVFENNNASIGTHSLFLGLSNTPLPFQSETFLYGGNSLYVRANEELDIDKRVISLMKNDTLKRTSSSFEINKRFTDILNAVDTLDTSTKYDSVDGSPTEDVYTLDEFELESSCDDIIIFEEDTPPKKKVQQKAIWELFTTEVGFIKDVKIIIDIFQDCFKKLQDQGFLTEVREELIFANIGEIYDVNVTFWRSLKEVVDNARNTKQPISPCQLVGAFENFEELFQPYIQFCNADTSNMHLPDYSPSTNDMVKQYITWCDNHEQCKRITMAGFLIKPLQRVTKYSLLLKAILNKSEDENEKSTTEDIRSRVETFVSKINSAINLRQEQEKINNVLLRLSDYCPIETMSDEAERIIKEYCNLSFKEAIPGLSADEKRFILKEGAMKLVEKGSKKDVYAFLFSDVFVITKLKRNIDKFRINRQPYRLNKLIVREMKDPGQLLFIYLNEYGVAANAYICQVDLNEQEKWKSAIEKAKANYEIIRTEYGLRDNFWDDDLPTSSVSANKVLKRAAHIRKNKRDLSTSSEPNTEPPTRTQPQEMKYEWDMTLSMIVMVIIFVLNIFVSRIRAYFE